MHHEATLLDEDFPARLCASFASQPAAMKAAERLEALDGSGQVQVIPPQKAAADQAAAHGSDNAVPRAGRRLYLRGIAVGVAGGLGLGSLHIVMSPVMAERTGGLLVFVALFGAVAGLLLSGLIGWRSAPGIAAPKQPCAGLQAGGWQVVFTAKDLAQHYEARRTLAWMGATEVRPV